VAESDRDARARGRWPVGARAAAFFSFDVDGESWLLGADERNAGLPVTMSQAAYGPRVGAFEILALLARYEVRATFFVPAWVARQYPRTLAAIVEGGHEVGLHGDKHERPDLLDREEELEIVQRSIEVLHEAAGQRPRGYRAPGAEVSPDTVSILAECGVRYSSQFMDDIVPYFHRPTNLPEVVEIPMHWTCDDWGYSMVSPYALPVAHVNPIATSEHIISVWRDELEGARAMGGVFVLVNHPQVTGRPGRLRTLEALLEAAKTADDVWIANGAQIDEHWRTHAASEPALRPEPERG
jgi:peptidoglycan/xylan/chitin deacetylase (PgdA/CDA1 family)